jgi:hypothetical protein
MASFASSSWLTRPTSHMPRYGCPPPRCTHRLELHIGELQSVRHFAPSVGSARSYGQNRPPCAAVAYRSSRVTPSIDLVPPSSERQPPLLQRNVGRYPQIVVDAISPERPAQRGHEETLTLHRNPIGRVQIQTSFSAVRSPPSCPVLSTPRGSISNSFTSCSA